MKRPNIVVLSGFLAASLVVAGGLFVWKNLEHPGERTSVPSGVFRDGEARLNDDPAATRLSGILSANSRAEIRFASLIEEKARELAARRQLAARRVRYARGSPGFLDPKTSPFLDYPNGQVIDLELFEDTHLPMVLVDTEVLESGVQLVSGTIEGYPDSRFLMAISDGSASLSIEVSPDRHYLVDALEDGVYEIQEVDPGLVPPCLAPLPMYLDADMLAARGQDGERPRFEAPPAARASDPNADALIDLLVVYSTDMANAHSLTSIRLKTELAVREANGDFERSGARVRLRLSHLQAVDYTENASNSDALERLRRTADDYMDEVHAIRDQVGADVVCLLQEKQDSSSSGIAYVMTESGNYYNEGYGFSVVEFRYLTGVNTLVHEVGHNLGCQHDTDHAGSPGLFSFSFGYHVKDRNGSVLYRTIMAYRPGTRISYFSTPHLTYGASQYAVGVADEADNVESLNRASFEVSNYRLAESDLDPTAKMINVSTRAIVGNGDEVLIGGFAVGGSEDKTVLVRALGPSLRLYGVRDPLSALKVTLFQDKIALAENSGWRMGPDFEQVIKTGFAPGSDLEPAILMTVQPGLYTAVVEATDGARGVSLVEVYDVGDTGPHLVNLSTRGYVGTGEEVLIGGFVIVGRGDLTKRILIRALGPSLADFGVSGAMFDPAMTLYDESGVVLLENDDWDKSNLQDVIAQLGYAPKVRRESAMILDLTPGLYTVVVRPFENTEGQEPGVGLIEAYEIE
ncbi:MAG: hypothetical protein DRP71_04400 [Verrucomicrobia bacterium]|nr:MAG: hypothetical protein DRP71_04400 [Verrucomicrobiota bacterium]